MTHLHGADRFDDSRYRFESHDGVRTFCSTVCPFCNEALCGCDNSMIRIDDRRIPCHTDCISGDIRDALDALEIDIYDGIEDDFDEYGYAESEDNPI
ncbi:MAG: hypothetical protein ACI4RV_06485 [Eubacteriales bacterium]